MRKMKFLKGMGAGLIVGACIGMTVAADNKRCRRFFCSAARTVSGLVEDLGDALGL